MVNRFHIFFLIIPCFVLSQTLRNTGLKATYKIKPNSYQKENNEKEDDISQIKNILSNDYLIMIEESSKIMTFTLVYKNNKKHFSRNSFITPEYLNANQTLFMTNFKDEIHFADYKNKIFINHYEFQGKKYNLINEEIIDDWEITSETKLINAFLCYKVVKKGNKSQFPIIWFAPELSFPIGPFDFNNFPGMVLEVNYKILTVFCEKIEFENEYLDFGPITEPQGISITNEEFKKIFDKAIGGLTE